MVPVDHRIFVVGIGREMLEDPLPDSRLRPPAETPVHVFPIPEAFRQIAPGYPGAIAVQHRFDEPPVVDRGHANPTLAPRKQVPDAVPLIIAKSVAAHRSAPEADRLRIGKPAAPELAICRQRDDCSGSVAFRTQSPQCAELTTRPSSCGFFLIGMPKSRARKQTCRPVGGRDLPQPQTPYALFELDTTVLVRWLGRGRLCCPLRPVGVPAGAGGG